jgi:hypothetical protein
MTDQVEALDPVGFGACAAISVGAVRTEDLEARE